MAPDKELYIAGEDIETVVNIGIDLTGILGGRMAGLTVKVLLYGKKHIFLHCNASNLVLKILQHDNLGDNPRSKLWGTCPLVPPVIYAHGLVKSVK